MEKPAGEEKVSQGQKRREVMSRRRDNRCLENILRSITTLSDTEKFEALKTKYVELYEQVRVANSEIHTLKISAKGLHHQVDTMNGECTKAALMQSRLGGLCRELQKQNKEIKEECKTKMKAEDDMRKVFEAKFQTTLAEVTHMLQENNEKNMKLRDENQDMANKITSLCQEFERGEQEIARLGTQMSLEKQLSEANVAKAKLELQGERELWAKEREMLVRNLKKSEDTCAQLQVNVKALESHLQLYTGKYEEFESTISKSSQMFDNCKNEMVKMTKQNTSLDKEVRVWKARSEHYAKLVLDLTQAKQVHDVQLANADKKVEQLQKLCRQLQVDRAAYLKLLKVNAIEPSSQICVDNTASPPTSQKPTKKEQELEHLKTNLKALEEQFATLTTTPDSTYNTSNGSSNQVDNNTDGYNIHGNNCEDLQESPHPEVTESNGYDLSIVTGATTVTKPAQN